MGGKSGSEVEITAHYMSMHIGICAYGYGIELLEVKIGDKIAWRGKMKSSDVKAIDKPDLFGGEKREGGARGLLWWLNGDENQMMPWELAGRFGKTPSTCVAFRGLSSIFLTGSLHKMVGGDEPENPKSQDSWIHRAANLLLGRFRALGFYWSANNPYLKTVSARVRRAPQGLNPSTALLRIQDSSKGYFQYAANPAHIIFECMTNGEWGMGESLGAFDIASYEQAAQTLYNEKFGVNMIWTRQSSIEDFVKEVLDHIQGAQYVDPVTGKHTLKLLRAVNLIDSIPRVDPDNAKMSNFKMKAWGDITSEVVVTWTNPESGKEETVAAQDIATIATQGAQPASSSRNYYGIASRDLAVKVADRDLAAVVHPIATCEVEVTKQFWKTVTYDVVELHWPERQIESAYFRVSSVTAGSTSNTVIMALYEDVFSLGAARYLDGTGGTEWTDQSQPPEPLINYQIGTAPAFMTAKALGLNDPSALIYPEAISAITIGPDSQDDVDYDLIGYEADVSGTTSQVSMGNRALRGTWELAVPLVAEALTTINDPPTVMGLPPAAGNFALIGTGADSTTEIVVFREVTNSKWVIDRGMLDTTPKAWAAGTRLFAIPAISDAADTTRRAAGETASYHFLTRTSTGTLAIEDAPQVNITLSERPHLPNRPANVSIDTTNFGTFDFGAKTSATVAWSRRNRINEATQVLRWTAADMAPETDQTTTIHLLYPNGTLLRSFTDIVGTSYTLQRSDLMGVSPVIMRVVAVRTAMESLQGHEITLTV